MVSPKFVDTNSVLLVDGTNLLIRIMHSKNSGNNLLTQPEMIETCAQIFIHQIVLCVKKYSCTRLCIAFDQGGSLRKKAIFEEYKQNRVIQASTSGYPSQSSEPSLQFFAALKEATISLCRLFNLSVFTEFGIEADDMIGIATEQLSILGKQVVILSNDSDFLQLVKHPKVVCSIPYKKMDVCRDNFTGYFSECSKSKGVNIVASEYLFYKSLVGDTSDNINGLPGIGYKKLYKIMDEQLAAATQEERNLYLTDSLGYIKLLAQRNASKLEKLMAENLPLLERNYKLIELSSTYISANTVNLTLKKLMEREEFPSRKVVISDYRKIFGIPANLEFVINSLFSLRTIYHPEKSDNIVGDVN